MARTIVARGGALGEHGGQAGHVRLALQDAAQRVRIDRAILLRLPPQSNIQTKLPNIQIFEYLLFN
jgi:hypothetical protein